MSEWSYRTDHLALIQIGRVWVRPDDISAIEADYYGQAKILLRSGQDVRIGGKTVDQAIEIIRKWAEKAGQ